MRYNMELICEKYTRITAEMNDEDHDLINLDRMEIVQYGTERYSVFSDSYVPREFGERVPLNCAEEDPDEQRELKNGRFIRKKGNTGKLVRFVISAV